MYAYININNGLITYDRPENDGIYTKIMLVETPSMIAIMPTTIGVAILNNAEVEINLPWNLYKETMANASRGKSNSKCLVNALKERFGVKKIVSTALFHATNQVMEESDYAEDYDFWNRSQQPKADAITTAESDIGLCVYSADCIICAIEDTKTGRVSALHSMWRNLLDGTNGEGIIEATVKAMVAHGSNPTDLRVYFFPCASKENYEVGLDVAEQFRNRNLSEAVIEVGDSYRLDLIGAASMLFERAGVPLENLYCAPATTDDPEFCGLRNAAKGRKTDSDFDASGIFKNETPVGAEELSKQNCQNILFVLKK